MDYVEFLKLHLWKMIEEDFWPDPNTLKGRQLCFDQSSFAIRWAAFLECYNLFLVHISHHFSLASALFFKVFLLDSILVFSALYLIHLQKTVIQQMASMIITGAIGLQLMLLISHGGAKEYFGIAPAVILMVFAINGVRASKPEEPRSQSFDDFSNYHDKAS